MKTIHASRKYKHRSRKIQDKLKQTRTFSRQCRRGSTHLISRMAHHPQEVTKEMIRVQLFSSCRCHRIHQIVHGKRSEIILTRSDQGTCFGRKSLKIYTVQQNRSHMLFYKTKLKKDRHGFLWLTSRQNDTIGTLRKDTCKNNRNMRNTAST